MGNEALGEQGRPQKWQATEINTIIDNLSDWERMKNPYKFDKYGNQRGFQKKQSYNHVEQKSNCSKFLQVNQEETPFD